MLFQSCSSCEGLVAYSATVRFVTCVNPHVNLQPAVPGEGLATFFANDVLPLLVLPDHVFVEVLLSHHSPLAHLTLVLGFVMGELLVHVQGIAVQTGLPANVADYWLLFVTETDVISQVPFHLELLATSLAGELEIIRVLPGDVDLQLVLVFVLVIALVAAEQFRQAVRSAGLRHSVFPFDVRVQGRFFSSLEGALVAREYLVEILRLVLALVIVQRALLLAFEVAKVAMLFGRLFALFQPRIS